MSSTNLTISTNSLSQTLDVHQITPEYLSCTMPNLSAGLLLKEIPPMIRCGITATRLISSSVGACPMNAIH